jgi:uncharacterized membrane protein YfhO
VTNASAVKVSAPGFSARRVEFDLDAAQPALTVISQSFSHNWHAYVSGRPVPLLRANHAFQALEIPQGHQHVKLVYEDHAFHVGLAISLASALIWTVFWLRTRSSA